MTTDKGELLLGGLPADNPLGFMAALGALVVTRRVWPEPGEREGIKLRWEPAAGGWRPLLITPAPVSRERLVELLLGELRREVAGGAGEQLKGAKQALRSAKAELKKAEDALKQRLKSRAFKRGSPEHQAAERLEVLPLRERYAECESELRRVQEGGAAPDPTTALGLNLRDVSPVVLRTAASGWAKMAASDNRRLVDLAAAFGCDGIRDNAGKLEPTRFSKHNGAGGKNMLADLSALMQQIAPERIDAALFAPWDYADRRYGLGWDPADARAHAHMAENPDDGEGAPTMHAANLLAYEGLALTPAVPRGTRLITTGTVRTDDTDAFTWPIWRPELGAPVVRSVLAMPGLHVPVPDRDALHAMGVVEVFRAEHFTFGKYPRFRPARSV